MAKTKELQTAPEPQQEPDAMKVLSDERDLAREGLELLQQMLDWCGEQKAVLAWGEVRPGGPKQVRVRIAELEIVHPCEDAIEGALEAVQLMQARLARREQNQRAR